MNIFTPLNNLIKIVADAGLSHTVYWCWHAVNISVIFSFCIRYRKHYGIGRADSLIIPAVVYSLGLLWILILGWIASGFSAFGSNNIVKGFSFFPIFALVPAKLRKIEWKKIMDFLAPAFPLLQFAAHLACNFSGCCEGYPWEYGIWNPKLETYLFPTQLVESFVALVICILCVIIAKKQNYKVTGKIYPFFLISFGSTRFFLEFLRNNTKIVGNISELALWALLMVVVGICWLIADKLNSERHERKEKHTSQKLTMHRTHSKRR